MRSWRSRRSCRLARSRSTTCSTHCRPIRRSASSFSTPAATIRWRARWPRRCPRAAGRAPRAASPAQTAKRAGAGTPAAAGVKPAGGEVDWTVEQKLWDEASKRNTIAHYELYLTQYPKGRFADVAKLNVDQLKEAEAG